MAIMTFSSDLKVVEDFTDDRDELAKDIKDLTIGEGSDMANTVSDDSAADTGAAFTQDDTEFNIFNTDRQLSALETAVKMLGSLPEKKALVYFASGMSRTGVDNQAQLHATINAAIRANVSFYPIDARGLVASAPLGDATKGSPGGQGMYSGSSARSATSNFQNQQETLYTLAADTGGKALLDNNDLSHGHRAGAEGYFELLHHRLLQHQREPGRPLPPHQGADQQQPLGQAGLPQRLLRRQGVQQVQLLATRSASCRRP